VHRHKKLKNWMLRYVFGPTREKVTGDWRKLHSKELHNLYSSPNIISLQVKTNRWMGHVQYMGKLRNVYWVLGGKPEETTWHRREDDIKMYITMTEREGVGQIYPSIRLEF
jgi:hypothetical protein